MATHLIEKRKGQLVAARGNFTRCSAAGGVILTKSWCDRIMHGSHVNASMPDSMLLADISTSARALAQAPSGCVPDASLLLTYADSGQRALRRLAFSQAPSCLLARTLSALMGYDDGIGARRVVANSFWTAPSASGGFAFYQDITWFKWHLLEAVMASRGVARALLLEADVIILRPPFEPLLKHPGLQAPGVAIAYQPERPACAGSCNDARCAINSGQLLVTNATASKALVRSVLQRQPRWVTASNLGDQDVAAVSVHRTGRCAMPSEFVGHCGFWYMVAPLPAVKMQQLICAATTYHACGTKPHEKWLLMQSVLNRTERCDDRTR